ncbi:MAG: CocE/NonD family hydrolase [Asticcacaulis sp.]
MPVSNRKGWRLALCLGTALALSATIVSAQESPAAKTEKISEFGRYSGYSIPTYDGHVRTSEYMTARDGTRLAVDIYRPTRNGQLTNEAFPTVWIFTPYNRSTRRSDGKLETGSRLPLDMLNHGYAFAVADVRGKGASFGVRAGPADRNETTDAYDITEWLAAQPWSNGNIGMMGCSYYGATALQALKSRPPHLKAVFAGTTTFDQYNTFGKGGIASKGLADEVTASERVVEVDADPNRTELAKALEGRKLNTPTGQFFASTPFRDDINPYTKDQWWKTGSFYPDAETMKAGAALYLYGGYYDVYPDQTIHHYLNAGPNTKLTFGNWHHCESPGFALDTERLRFFDYWLKGTPNGVMDGPPIHTYVTRAADGTEWRALEHWTQDVPRTRYYLNMDTPPGQPRARVLQPSLIGGSLSADKPASDLPAVELANVPTTTPHVYYGLPRTGIDPYSATFTLPAQEDWREIIGSPTVRLWVSSEQADADIYVYLESAHVMGGTETIARGALRVSHRKTGTAPYKVDGVPWQTHARADHQPLTSDAPVAIDIALTPTAFTFRPGDLLRLAVTTRPPLAGPESPAPVKLHLDANHPSYLEVPDVDTRDAALDKVLGGYNRPNMIGKPVK